MIHKPTRAVPAAAHEHLVGRQAPVRIAPGRAPYHVTAGEMDNLAYMCSLTGEQKWAEKIRRRALLIAAAAQLTDGQVTHVVTIGGGETVLQ